MKTTTTVKASEIMEIINENGRLGYAAELKYHIEYGGYISDVIHEIADNNTSIYYSDIMDFIRHNPESLADVIDEGLYDPSAGYDLYQHGQAAEYMMIEREIYNNLDAGLEYAALVYLVEKYDDPEVSEELIEGIHDICIDSWRLDHFNEITDYIDEYFTDEQEAITA